MAEYIRISDLRGAQAGEASREIRRVPERPAATPAALERADTFKLLLFRPTRRRPVRDLEPIA